MRIAVFGSGGVGGYFGARLQQAGDEVAFVARGRHLDAMRREGLRIESPRGDAQLTVTASDDPAELGAADVVLVATKTFQLDEAMARMGPLVGEETLVVPLLNGVEAPARLAKGLARGTVVGGLCRIIAFVAEPGRIQHVGADPYVAFGRLDGEKDPRVDALAEAFRRAGVEVDTPTDIAAAMWRKFLMVAAWGAVGAVSRAPIGTLLEHEGTHELLTGALDEIVRVAEAYGVALGGGAVRAALAFYAGLPAEATTSLQRDVAEGRPSELGDWSGSVVRLGARARVATPVHGFVAAALEPLERRARGEIDFA